MASVTGNVGIFDQAKGAQSVSAGVDRQAALLVSELNARFSQLSLAGRLFFAQAIVTAPVIYTTAAGTGGPLLWNPPSSGVNAQLLAISFGETIVTTVAAAIGITGNTGQNLIPASTTTIDGSTPLLLGGATAKVQSYRVGTPTNAGNFLIPVGQLSTGALTTSIGGMNFAFLDGMLTFGPGSWVSPSTSATASTTVIQIGLIWAELPV